MIPSNYFFHDGTKYILAGNEGLAMSHFHEIRAHLHQMKRTNVFNLPILTGTKIFDDGTEAHYRLTHGAEIVSVASPLIVPQEVPPELTRQEFPELVLLLPIFDDEYYWNTSYEYYTEYGSLVLLSDFSSLLWIAEKNPVLFTEREPPTRYMDSDFKIEEKRLAGKYDRDFYDELDAKYAGEIGSVWREVGWSIRVQNDKSLEDCWMFTWNESYGWVDNQGYSKYAYGININGEWIDLYRGAYPDFESGWWGAFRTYCCEIYAFNGTPVYVFAYATGKEMIYGYHYNGEMILQAYEAPGNPLGVFHELESDMHQSGGVARGRLRIGEKTQIYNI